MTRLALLRRVALATLIAPTVLGAQASAYTLEDIVGMLKNRVPQRRIIDLAGKRCVDFVVDSRSEARLKETGASASFVDELKEVCNPNVPRREAAAPVADQAAIPVSFMAAIIDSDLTVRPIPQHDLVLMGPRGDTTRISTNLQGEATGSFAPGIYRIESAQAVELQGSRYRWSMFVPIQPGMKAIELTQRNATVEPIAVAAAAESAPAPVQAAPEPTRTPAAPAAPSRPRLSEEAEIFEKYRPGLFTVFGEEARGSAFLFDSAGLLLTQAHIVRNSDNVRVQIDSTTKIRARIISRDTVRDVAVLAINPARCGACVPLPFIEPPTGPVATVGERVLAAGSPLNRQALMSIGIVNALDDANVTSDVNIGTLNAGGPLLNLAGEVIAVNVHNDGRRLGRPKTPVSLPVSSALPVILRARDSISALRSNPPSDSLLPLAPPEQFPAEPIAALVSSRDAKLDAYMQRIESSRLFMMTPQVMGLRHARAFAELTKRRQEGKTKGIVDDRIDPIQLWPDWSDYLTQRKAVVVFNVVPQSTEYPFYEPEKAPDARDGSVRRVRIYRDGVEIVPIETIRIPAALTGPERAAAGQAIPYQVINVYRAPDFGPKPDGSPASFSVAVQRMGQDMMPTPVPLERKIVEQIIKDFTPFFVGLRMR